MIKEASFIFKIFCLFFLTVCVSSEVDEWSDYYTFKRATYLVNNLSKTYLETTAFCEAKGGKAVSVQDEQENSFIKLLLTNEASYWLGLNRTNQTWLDNLPFTYSNFNNNESAPSCSVFTINGSWESLDCNSKAKTICKLDENKRCNANIRESFRDIQVKLIVLEDEISTYVKQVKEFEALCNLTIVEQRIENITFRFVARENEYIRELKNYKEKYTNELELIRKNTDLAIKVIQHNNERKLVELSDIIKIKYDQYEKTFLEAKEHLKEKIENTTKFLDDKSFCFNETLKIVEQTVNDQLRSFNLTIKKSTTKQNVVNNLFRDMFQFVYVKLEKIRDDIKYNVTWEYPFHDEPLWLNSNIIEQYFT